VNARQVTVIRERYRIAVSRGDMVAQRTILARHPWAAHTVTGRVAVLRSAPDRVGNRVTAPRYVRGGNAMLLATRALTWGGTR